MFELFTRLLLDGRSKRVHVVPGGSVPGQHGRNDLFELLSGILLDELSQRVHFMSRWPVPGRHGRNELLELLSGLLLGFSSHRALARVGLPWLHHKLSRR